MLDHKNPYTFQTPVDHHAIAVLVLFRPVRRMHEIVPLDMMVAKPTHPPLNPGRVQAGFIHTSDTQRTMKTPATLLRWSVVSGRWSVVRQM